MSRETLPVFNGL